MAFDFFLQKSNILCKMFSGVFLVYFETTEDFWRVAKSEGWLFSGYFFRFPHLFSSGDPQNTVHSSVPSPISDSGEHPNS